MRYITPRKAAQGQGAAPNFYPYRRKAASGLGSARSGTTHHWNITMSSYALIVLTPLFLIAVGGAIGLPQDQVVAHFGRPFPGIITALFVIVGMIHFIKGSQGGAIADYVHGTAQQLTMVAIAIFGWGVIAAAIFALAKMAFTLPAI